MDVTEQENKLAEKHSEYLSSHPELKVLLGDFMTDLLADKPDDVFTYARTFFQKFKQPEPAEPAAPTENSD
ncbi:hypothetical protein J8273_0234 [Carpediemonas membranifera]|uniref:RIIa domain-containing protein n=1 Tax=Carpediemonas membranifera TaxID=201153 RepID=A0A8J6BD70_9EUKA|nr:hypothetical protein J8273_0234 [Carpediemonas membranifera]|eukprot:KAG9395022.1 hypothetical protein J8273_0234 [Carpediemonas membranifera]